MNMSLETEVQEMYADLLAYINGNRDELSNGLLLLTDMGSLNSFANLIYEETGIRTKAISMTSTMIVIEALRMADAGRSLEEISIKIFKSLLKVSYGNNLVHFMKRNARKKPLWLLALQEKGWLRSYINELHQLSTNQKLKLYRCSLSNVKHSKNTLMAYWKSTKFGLLLGR